jgi:hypothetical protein
MEENFLYYGDNLDVLRRHIKDETVDLIYLDPPFKSDQDYNILFAERNGSKAAAQIKAFDDTWHWDKASAAEKRRGRDSNPRSAKGRHRFSRPARSAAPTPLRMQIVDLQLPIVNAQHGQAAANPLFATEVTALYRHGFTLFINHGLHGFHGFIFSQGNRKVERRWS